MQKRRNPEVIAGRVNSDGSIAAGDGFSVNKAGTGIYDITFALGFRLLNLTPNIANTNVRLTSTGSYTDRSVRVSIFTTGVVAQDDTFGFIAVGVQQ